MEIFIVQVGVVQKTLNEIRVGMIYEFWNPKYESQCLTEINEIKQLPTKYVWEFDQRFKTLMSKLSFQMSVVQHKEWFIASLLPHIRTPLTQQKIVSQIETLEIAMKLESSPVGYTGSGIMQIQSQLANLTVQL